MINIKNTLIGYKENLMGTKGWGEMTRKGFTQKP